MNWQMCIWAPVARARESRRICIAANRNGCVSAPGKMAEATLARLERMEKKDRVTG
jgi:hypothetical protein